MFFCYDKYIDIADTQAVADDDEATEEEVADAIDAVLNVIEESTKLVRDNLFELLLAAKAVDKKLTTENSYLAFEVKYKEAVLVCDKAKDMYVTALWEITGNGSDITVVSSENILKKIDMYGNVSMISPGDMTLTTAPVYIYSEAPLVVSTK